MNDDLPTPAMRRMDLRVIGLKAEAMEQRERAERAEAQRDALAAGLVVAYEVIDRCRDGWHIMRGPGDAIAWVHPQFIDGYEEPATAAQIALLREDP